MIGYLSGTQIKSLPIGVVLDVQGVGYIIETPLSTLSTLPGDGNPLSLWIYTLMREDSLRLFGFITFDERQVFSILLTMNGVGPKVALAMLSALGVQGIRDAALRETPEPLLVVPGIGPRLADKITVELKGKLPKIIDLSPSSVMTDKSSADDSSHLTAAREMLIDDVMSALANLGFKGKNVQRILVNLKGKLTEGDHHSHQEIDSLDFQAMLRYALSQLSTPNNSRGIATETDSQILNEVF